MSDLKKQTKELAQMFAQDTGAQEKIEAVMDAAFGDKKKFDPVIEKAPSHCVVLNPQGDITFSVSIGKEFGFNDYRSAHAFCQQHVMDCTNNGVPMASRWKVRPAFVSIA